MDGMLGAFVALSIAVLAFNLWAWMRYPTPSRRLLPVLLTDIHREPERIPEPLGADD